jgi:hypothetical protein
MEDVLALYEKPLSEEQPVVLRAVAWKAREDWKEASYFAASEAFRTRCRIWRRHSCGMHIANNTSAISRGL